MTKEMRKIITWMEHGVDDRIILLEMIRSTGNTEFIRKCEHLVELQTPSKQLDLQQKFERVANKINSFDEHLKSGASETLINDLADKHYSTLKKIEAEIAKYATSGSREVG